MSEPTHPRLWLAYVLLLLTGQTGLYNFYLHRSGPGMVMLMGFFGMIAIFLIPVAKIAAYISIAGLAVLTLIVFIDVFRMPKLVARAHANSLGGQS